MEKVQKQEYQVPHVHVTAFVVEVGWTGSDMPENPVPERGECTENMTEGDDVTHYF